MPKIIFIDIDGSQHTIEATPGESVMQAAVRRGIPGILAECGGSCSCATCHVHIDPRWAHACGTATDLERSMLEMSSGWSADSRLACQITVSAELEGMVVRIPASEA